MGTVWHDINALAQQLEYRKRVGVFVVMTSGYFDILHVGHVRLIQQSQFWGSRIVVVVNSDEAAVRKKGYVTMKLVERMEVVAAIAGVNDVVAWDGSTVAGALEIIRPHVFTKGGDRSSPAQMSQEELDVCKKIGCTVAYGVGGTEKIQSSSWLAGRRSEGDGVFLR